MKKQLIYVYCIFKANDFGLTKVHILYPFSKFLRGMMIVIEPLIMAKAVISGSIIIYCAKRHGKMTSKAIKICMVRAYLYANCHLMEQNFNFDTKFKFWMIARYSLEDIYIQIFI